MNTPTPTLKEAMTQVESLRRYFALIDRDAPTELQVMNMLNIARSRGRFLSKADWLQVWKLGRDRIAVAERRLRWEDGDIDDATASVCMLFHPDDAYDHVRALTA